jgi:hypothetical protein
MRRLLIIAPLLLLFLVACQQQPQPLRPIRPTATPGGDIVGQPVLVTFTELEADPFTYRDRLIRATGDYIRLPAPPCRFERGPRIRWALIADNLRMDAVGFEPILRLAPEGISITVDGIWRRYEGPLGCGKRPPAGVAWHLDVQRIVYPNPFPQFEGILVPPPLDGPGPPQPPATLEPLPTPTPPVAPPAGPTATATLSIIITPLPTTTPGPIGPTATPTPFQAPTATATIPALVTPTPLPLTPPVVTPVATPTPTATSPSGYPGPPPPPPPGYP